MSQPSSSASPSLAPPTNDSNNNNNNHQHQRNEEEQEEDICAICLFPLSDGPSESLTLSCSHRFHHACLVAQITHATTTNTNSRPSRRLLFNAIRCSLCQRVCSHPKLDALVKPSADLLAEVDVLSERQLRVDGITSETPIVRRVFGGDAIAYARAAYAFYQCSVCSRPFFGGTVECADREDLDIEPPDRVCRRCSASTTNICDNVDEHGEMHAWKCRLCCSQANFLCYANVHLCYDCHERNSAAGRNGIGTANRENLKIGPKPCQCEHETHENGSGPECEKLLFCAICENRTVPEEIDPDEMKSGNLIYNGDAQHGMEGWFPSGSPFSYGNGDGGGAVWSVQRIAEHSNIPALSSFTHNFVSSFQLAGLAQAIDLSTCIPLTSIIDAANDNTRQLSIEVSARYVARNDCPSFMRLALVVYDEQMNQLADWNSGDLEAPVGYWARAAGRLQVPDGAKYAVAAFWGQDKRCWRGWYGSKVTGVSVRLVASNREEVNLNTRDVSEAWIDQSAASLYMISETGAGSNSREGRRRRRREFVPDIGIDNDRVDDEYRGPRPRRVPILTQEEREQRRNRLTEQMTRLTEDTNDMSQRVRNATVGSYIPRDAQDTLTSNLVRNGNGAQGLQHWVQRPNSMSDAQWDTEIVDSIGHAFVASHQWATQAQAIRLPIVELDGSDMEIEVFAKYRARDDCPSVFKIRSVVYDERNLQITNVDATLDSGVLDAPRDEWNIAGGIIKLNSTTQRRARWIVLAISGKDQRYWAGRYGPKCTACSVRVLQGRGGEGTIRTQSVQEILQNHTNEDERRTVVQMFFRDQAEGNSSTARTTGRSGTDGGGRGGGFFRFLSSLG